MVKKEKTLAQLEKEHRETSRRTIQRLTSAVKSLGYYDVHIPVELAVELACTILCHSKGDSIGQR